MRWLLISLLLVLPFSNTYADLGYAQLKELTHSQERMSGSFLQSKYLKLLDASIESSGVFEYQQNTSIRWITKQPVSNELIMTNTQIINKQGDQELVKIDLHESGSAKLLHELLFSVMTAEWDYLASMFSVSGNIDGERWVATLDPKDGTVKKLVRSIELSGTERVDRIAIFENGGDVTNIRFSYPK